MSSIATTQPGYNPEAIGLAGIGEASVEQSHGILDRLRSTRLGTALALGGASLSMVAGGEALSAEAAEATVGGNSTSVITNTQTGVTVRSAHSWQKDGDFSKVIVMGNHRVVSRAEVEEARQEGDCFWANGKKEEIYVEGVTATGVGMGRDTRKSEFCQVDEDVNGDGKVNDEDIVRAKCGNFAVVGEKPEGALEDVIWVEGKGKIKISARSKAKAWANCTTSDGLASAGAEGYGEASASGFLKMKGSIKSIVKRAQGKINHLVEQSLSGKGMAKSKAHAVADAQCTESNGTPPPTNVGSTLVELVDTEHVLVNGTREVCFYESDPEGDITTRSLTESGSGEFLTNLAPSDEPGEWCRVFKGSTTPGNANLTAHVEDAAGNESTDTDSFPVVAENGGPGTFNQG